MERDEYFSSREGTYKRLLRLGREETERKREREKKGEKRKKGWVAKRKNEKRSEEAIPSYSH